MPKIKTNKCTGWKPVKLEGTVLSDGIDGLVGIEELTNYKFETKKRNARVLITKEQSSKASKTKTEKRIHSNEDAEIEPSPKKAKLKKPITTVPEKKKKSKVKIVEPVQEESGIDSDSSRDDSDNGTENFGSSINVDSWRSLGVPTPIIKALARQKFHSPTPIQTLTIAPAILGRRDILGAAETGSGKTLAFGIPILNGIMQLKAKHACNSKEDETKVTYNNDIDTDLSVKKFEDDFNSEGNDVQNLSDSDFEERELDDEDLVRGDGIGCVRVIDNIKINEGETRAKKPLYALILTPTRELAIQIRNHLENAAKYTDIKIAVVVGGMAAVKQERILSKGPEIVIATPGRLWELIEEGNPHLSQVDSIKFLAIDETDRMLERGHFQELHNLLERMNVNEAYMKQRQTFVFSATLTLVHDLPDHLQRKKKRYARSKIYKLTPGQKLQKIIDMLKIKKPKIVDVTKQSGTADNLTECRIACTIDHKDYYLYYFLKRHIGRTLIFCNSIGCVKRLATLFGILDCKPLPLHASMPQRQRLKNLERFQADENGILVATDVAARGLDIPNVEHVIHYQVPRTSEGYVHRSGRTARAQKEGITVLMMEPSEKQYYTKLCTTLGRTQDLPSYPVIDRLLIAVKERVDVAREIDKLDLKCRRDNSQKGWIRKAVEDMDLVLDEDQVDSTMETEESADLRRQLKAKRRILASLLSKPLFPKGFSGKYPDINDSVCLNDTSQKAVDVVKRVIEEIPTKKKNTVSKSFMGTKGSKRNGAIKKRMKSKRLKKA